MMKRIGLLALMINSMLVSCPTCVGRIQEESPPFFSDEFYKPSEESLDTLMEEAPAQEES